MTISGVELGVQIIGSEIGVKSAFAESIAAADRWAESTEAASLKAARSLELTGLSAKQAAVAWAKLGVAAQVAAKSSEDSSVAMASAAVKAETTIRGAYARQEQAAMMLSATQERAAMKYETALMGAGRSLTTYLTVPMAIAGYAAIKLATNFQSSMTRVETLAGASAKEVSTQMTNILNHASQLPQGPIVAADSLYHLESIGIRGPKAFAALRAAAIAAGAGMADLQSATTALGGALVAEVKGADDAKQAMAGLVAITGMGNMTMQDMADAMGTGLLVKAHNVGLSLREVGSALAVLVDRGIPARRAATYLGTTFALMSAPSVAASNALADMGVDANKMGEMMLQPNGLLNVLNMLAAGMARVGQARGAADLMSAFGRSRQSTGIVTLIESLNAKTSSYSAKLAQYDHDVGESAKHMALYQETAAYKMHTALSQVEADFIKFGTAAMPYVADGLKSLSDIINTVTDAFDHLPAVMRTTLGVLAGFLVVGGPILLGVGLVMRGIRHLGDVMEQLGMRAKTGAAGADSAIVTIGTSADAASTQVAALNAQLAELGITERLMAGNTRGGLMFYGPQGMRKSMEPGAPILTDVGGISGGVAKDGGNYVLGPDGKVVGTTKTVAPELLGLKPGPLVRNAETGMMENAGAMTAASMAYSMQKGFVPAMKTGLARILPGTMWMMGGQFAGDMLQNSIGGQAGQTTGSVLRMAGLGAGIGTMIEPGIGTAIGGVLGGVAGGIMQLVKSGPGAGTQLEQLSSEVNQLGGAAQKAAADIVSAHGTITQLRLNKDQLETQVAADKRSLREAPNSRMALDRLAADQAQLLSIKQQIRQTDAQIVKLENQQAQATEKKKEKLGEIATKMQAIQKDVFSEMNRSSAFQFFSTKELNAAGMQEIVRRLRDMSKEAQEADPRMSELERRIARITARIHQMPSLKRIMIEIHEIWSKSWNKGPEGPMGPLRPGEKAWTPPPKFTGPAPLTEAQKVQLAFAENKYNRQTITEQIAIDNRHIAALKKQRASGKIDNLQYVNSVTAYLQDRQTMQERLKTLDHKKASGAKAQSDVLLAKAKNDLQQGFYQEAQRLLHEDLKRLQKMKAEAATAAERDAIEKQILAVQHVINSKAAGYQTSLALQEQVARADALAAADPGLAGPTKLQIKLAQKVKEAAMKAIHSGHLTLQGLIEAWQVVGQANATLAQGFSQSSRTYAHVSTAAIANSIEGLTQAQKMKLREELAQRDAHRGYRPVGAGAEGYVIPEHVAHRNAARAAGGGPGSSRAAGHNGSVVINHATIEINGIENPRQLLAEIERLTRRRGGQRTGTRR